LVPCILLLLSVFGIKIYIINGGAIKELSKKIKYATAWTDSQPGGYVVGDFRKGAYFLGLFIKADINKPHTLKIISTEKWIEDNMPIDTCVEKETDKIGKLVLYERHGPFWKEDLWNKRQIKLPTWLPNKTQKAAMDVILKSFEEDKYSVSLLYGAPGTGKSNVAPLIARSLLNKNMQSIALVDSYDLSDPNSSFDVLYSYVSPNEKNILIYVLEEVDELINKIHNNLIILHKHLPIQIKNKSSWNKWLDRINNGYYPHTIIIMTSNKLANWFDNLDTSYFRKGRVCNKINF
jgi:hypothetical protein